MSTDRRTPEDLQEAVAATLRRLRGEVRSLSQTGGQQRTEPQLSASAPVAAPVARPVPTPPPGALPAPTPVQAQGPAPAAAPAPAREPDLLTGNEPEFPPVPSVRPLIRESQASFLEEQAAAKSHLRWLPYGLSFVALVVFAGIVWWAYHAVTGAQKNGPVPVIAADQTPEKVPPADQNATDTPAPDKTVYDQISGTNTQPKTEVLLPAPATPQVPPPPPAPSPTMPTTTSADTTSVPPAEPAVPAATAETTPAPAPAVPAAPAAPATTTETMPAPAPAPDTTSAASTTGTEASTADLSGVPTLSPLTSAAPAPAAPAPSATATTASGADTSSTATTTATSTETTPTQTASIPDNYRIQVAASKSEDDANRLWKRILAKHQDVLGPLTVHIVRADLGAQGIYYRVQAGPFADRASARQACDALKAQDQQCLVKP